MASLPNLQSQRPCRPRSTESTQPRPQPQPVSFNLAHPPRGQAPETAVAAISPPLKTPGARLLTLPKGKRPLFSRHRHDANPALALKVLQDIQIAVEAWHAELRQTVQQIQMLYMEGPIVDGWLETLEAPSHSTPKIEADSALWRHGDPQALSGYVEQLCESLGDGQPDLPVSPPPKAQAQPSRYRLCSLNSDGQVQCLPCPLEQVSTLSLAIARHQKLRQLLDQKRYLQAKLKRAVEVLTGSRDALGIAPTCSSPPQSFEPEA